MTPEQWLKAVPIYGLLAFFPTVGVACLIQLMFVTTELGEIILKYGSILGWMILTCVLLFNRYMDETRNIFGQKIK
ncbi:hypothetical protein [Bacillus phage CP-51]|uniref:Uncharacterized protein n=1 Tax=Bacillus phage CP-51 TaxID=1391188 RepID=A0A068EUC6_9CAUD|nr:hypothetical protein OZ73_gp211 [Bacillus phage CP-51]AID50646.1 hypothetical protein [Bacillus phage CP-51]